MKIRALRWGYDGGGIACGPVEGNTIVEICATNSEKQNVFVTVSRMSEFEHVYISPLPAFDLLIHLNHYDVDFETEYAKVTAHTIEDYDYEIGDEPNGMFDSAYAKVIHLARLAMQEYYFGESKDSDSVRAEKFIEEYIGKDFDAVELPPLADETEDDEEYEDDEYEDEE
jgi:hypothetical protein